MMTSNTTFIALVNPRSGGNMGAQLLNRFKEILGESRVYNLNDEQNPGPKKALEKHIYEEDLRIIACGGDGTVGWILSVMDSMTFPRGRPSIGIIPLGTGNDLSRSLNWGGKYKSKPLKKFLMDIGKADKVTMDRWTLKATVDPSRIEKSSNADTKLCLNVMNNYFSVGIDAHIALKFHQARQTHPERFTHRTNNLIYYGYTGFKDLFKRDMSNLLDHISVICDGVDYTEKLKLYGTHSVMFLNIKSYSGGCRPWKLECGVPDMNDGLLEVVAIDNLDLAILNLGGSGQSVCQCKNAVIKTTKAIPMQVDGEPCLMQPCTIEINSNPTHEANMLCRNKKATYEVTDSEIKEWAAKTIQTSFREYKRRQNWVKVQHANTFIQVTKKASLKKKTSSTSVQSSQLEV